MVNNLDRFNGIHLSLGLKRFEDEMAKQTSGLGRGLFEEVDEVVLPDGGHGVGAVASGLVRDGDEYELCVRHVVDQLLCDA